MKNIILFTGLVMGMIGCRNFLAAQNNSVFAVLVSAVAEEEPPGISLIWPADPEAEQYLIYKKTHSLDNWGPPFAVLDGNATMFTDTLVNIGELYEYGVYKTPCLLIDTIAIAPGTPINFTIFDSWGDGICCSLGFGYYEVMACDSVYAVGGNFTFSESTSFEVPACSYSMTDVIISIYLDAIPEETTWILVNDNSGAMLASGGPYDIPKFGTISSGIKCPAIEQQGKVLLLVDNSYADDLAGELERLKYDLICDGWMVHRIDIDRNNSVQNIKSIIKDACANDTNINVLFLFGHIPVPYSGNIAMDGHPDHLGAWPADLYYGELDGEWTDMLVNSTSASRPENYNIPGDGKFDQSFIPSNVDLQVGRVDLFNLPAFSENDTELLKRYLNKDHNYRYGGVNAERRGLIDENLSESYHAVGWRNFAPMFGDENVIAADYLTTLDQESFLWSFGCGGSSYSACGGVASTNDFATKTINTVFTMLFGSYFGDWDNQNNVLRAPLASDNPILVNFWSCIPSWYLHQMAMGRNIGYCTRLTQNMNIQYTSFFGNRIVHTALMGDPTLRMHVVNPVPLLNLEAITDSLVLLTWDVPGESIEGYHVYRSNSINNSFQRLNTPAVTDTFFVDISPLEGKNIYMVRAIKLETTGSGTFYNLSQGIVDSINSDPLGIIVSPIETCHFIKCYPNPSNGMINIEVSGDLSETFIVEIIDQPGTPVFLKSILIKKNPQVLHLDLTGYPGGIYVVKLSYNNETESKKFILYK